MEVAEILFDGGGEPGRGQIEIDRPARQAPPQTEHPHRDEAGHALVVRNGVAEPLYGLAATTQVTLESVWWVAPP